MTGTRSDRHGSISLGAALIVIMSTAPLVQHAVPALAPHLVGAFDLSLVQLGMYSTLLFGMSAVLAPVMGRFSDRAPTRMLVTLLFVFGAIGALMVAIAPRFEVILASAIVTSIPMALAHPLTNQLLVSNTAGRTRSVLLAVKHSGVKLAQGAAGLLMAPLATAFGWRAAFSLPALLSVGGALWVPRFIGQLSQPELEPVEASRWRLPRSIWWLMGYSILMALSQSASSTYLAIYAFDELDFTLTSAGLLTGVLGLTGAISRICWGIWIHGTNAAIWPLQAMAIGCIPATGCVIAAPFVGAPLLWFATVVLGITTAIWNLAVTIVIFSLVPRFQTGRATGRVYFGFSFGMMIGPILFGWMVDAVGGYTLPWTSVVMWQFAALAATVPLYRRVRRGRNG